MSNETETKNVETILESVGYPLVSCVVSDCVFLRKLDSIILGIDQLSAELKHIKNSLLSGGRLCFDMSAVVSEHEDLVNEIVSANLCEFEESCPPNTGPK